MKHINNNTCGIKLTEAILADDNEIILSEKYHNVLYYEVLHTSPKQSENKKHAK